MSVLSNCNLIRIKLSFLYVKLSTQKYNKNKFKLRHRDSLTLYQNSMEK